MGGCRVGQCAAALSTVQNRANQPVRANLRLHRTKIVNSYTIVSSNADTEEPIKVRREHRENKRERSTGKRTELQHSAAQPRNEEVNRLRRVPLIQTQSGPPCNRCRERNDSCVFPPKGTSFIFRRPGRERRAADFSQGQGQGGNEVAVAGTVFPSLAAGRPRGFRPEDWVEARAKSLASTDPLTLLSDEVMNSYLRCSYKWSFHHIPSMLVTIREKTLDPVLVWAMLAITIRFSRTAPAGYSSQVEASNTFAAHARSQVLSLVDQPTLHRAQVLLMLTGHSWGAGEGRRAWVYLGMAVRMAQVLGIFEEETGATRLTTREAFIEAEERRRTAWTCFLMDSLLSGGKGRDRMLSADVMKLQLPCESDRFHFGEAVVCEHLDGTLPTPGPGQAPAAPTGVVGIIATTIRVADIWGAVAKWACSAPESKEPPWRPNSDFQYISSRLDTWRERLPDRLRYDLFLLRAHNIANQGQAYCYMHCIYFMSVIFLYRSYMPEVEMQSARTPKDPEWDHWSSWSSRRLMAVAEQVCDMLEEMRAFGLHFLRGLVPWIGFTIYTAVGTLLYFCSFPDPSEGPEAIKHRRQRIVQGCLFLKDMREAWPMADTWREKIKAMQIFYSNVKADGDQAVTQSERREMRNAMIDYGALQADPVRKADPEGGQEAVAEPKLSSRRDADMGAIDTMATSLHDMHDSSDAPATVGSTSEAATTVGSASEDYETQPMHLIEPADIDLFDTDFEFGRNLHASLADTTQGFWESFPGSMDITDDLMTGQ